MKITKINEDVTFIKKVVRHEFLINTKRVTVWEECYYGDNVMSEYDTNIDEKDYEALNEIEQEAMGEELNDLIRLQIDESLEYNENI